MTNRPAAAPAERFEVRSADGTMVPVFKSGSGPPLMLVHGAGPGHSVWDAVRPLLEELTELTTDQLLARRRARFRVFGS